MRGAGRALVAAAAVAWAAPAPAERLVLSLSSHRVLIGSNYTGAQLVAFGVIERDAQSVARPGGYEVVLTMRGPRQWLTVRRKEALGPIWLNRDQQKFVTVPAVLGVFASRPLDELTTPLVRRRQLFGLEAIVNSAAFTFDREGADDPFRSALIRLKMREGTWSEEGRGVTFLTSDVFRAPLPLPATAPIGDYDIEAVVVADGAVVARVQTNFEVVKTGLEDDVSRAARDHALLYGLGIAAMALMFGWLASVIFRRD